MVVMSYLLILADVRERERERENHFLCEKNMNWMGDRITNQYIYVKRGVTFTTFLQHFHNKL